MTDYIYLCPNCSDCLFAFGEKRHDSNMILPCESCGYDLELWQETPDERESGSWDYTDYGSPEQVLKAVDRSEVFDE